MKSSSNHIFSNTKIVQCKLKLICDRTNNIAIVFDYKKYNKTNKTKQNKTIYFSWDHYYNKSEAQFVK